MSEADDQKLKDFNELRKILASAAASTSSKTHFLAEKYIKQIDNALGRISPEIIKDAAELNTPAFAQIEKSMPAMREKIATLVQLAAMQINMIDLEGDVTRAENNTLIDNEVASNLLGNIEKINQRIRDSMNVAGEPSANDVENYKQIIEDAQRINLQQAIEDKAIIINHQTLQKQIAELKSALLYESSDTANKANDHLSQVRKLSVDLESIKDIFTEDAQLKLAVIKNEMQIIIDIRNQDKKYDTTLQDLKQIEVALRQYAEINQNKIGIKKEKANFAVAHAELINAFLKELPAKSPTDMAQNDDNLKKMQSLMQYVGLKHEAVIRNNRGRKILDSISRLINSNKLLNTLLTKLDSRSENTADFQHRGKLGSIINARMNSAGLYEQFSQTAKSENWEVKLEQLGNEYGFADLLVKQRSAETLQVTPGVTGNPELTISSPPPAPPARMIVLDQILGTSMEDGFRVEHLNKTYRVNLLESKSEEQAEAKYNEVVAMIVKKLPEDRQESFLADTKVLLASIKNNIELDRDFMDKLKPPSTQPQAPNNRAPTTSQSSSVNEKINPKVDVGYDKVQLSNFQNKKQPPVKTAEKPTLANQENYDAERKARKGNLTNNAEEQFLKAETKLSNIATFMQRYIDEPQAESKRSLLKAFRNKAPKTELKQEKLEFAQKTINDIHNLRSQLKEHTSESNSDNRFKEAEQLINAKILAIFVDHEKLLTQSKIKPLTEKVQKYLSDKPILQSIVKLIPSDKFGESNAAWKEMERQGLMGACIKSNTPEALRPIIGPLQNGSLRGTEREATLNTIIEKKEVMLPDNIELSSGKSKDVIASAAKNIANGISQLRVDAESKMGVSHSPRMT